MWAATWLLHSLYLEHSTVHKYSKYRTGNARSAEQLGCLGSGWSQGPILYMVVFGGSEAFLSAFTTVVRNVKKSDASTLWMVAYVQIC